MQFRRATALLIAVAVAAEILVLPSFERLFCRVVVHSCDAAAVENEIENEQKI